MLKLPKIMTLYCDRQEKRQLYFGSFSGKMSDVLFDRLNIKTNSL